MKRFQTVAGYFILKNVQKLKSTCFAKINEEMQLTVYRSVHHFIYILCISPRGK